MLQEPVLIRLSLPYAPSVNVIWRRGKNCTYKAKAAVDYNKAVLAERYLIVPDDDFVFSGFVVVHITVHPRKPKKPGKAWSSEACRRQDVDACVKIVLDSLQHARVFEDDRQVVMQSSCIGEPVDGGGVTVVVRGVRNWFESLEQPSESAVVPVMED